MHTPLDEVPGLTGLAALGSGLEPAAATVGAASPNWTLLARYEAYQRHQVREFLALLPREGLRGLYRSARATWSPETTAVDPVARLGEFVRERLPLPPFDVWCQDLRKNPAAHLDEPWMFDLLPDQATPFILETRAEVLQSGPWRADLRVYHLAGSGWLGHISFSRPGEGKSWRTADIFREQDAQSLLARFREFDRDALEAFLRSVVP